MSLWIRKISFMNSTLSSRLRCGPNVLSNKQKRSSSDIMGWVIFQHFLNSFELTFVIDKALVIWNWQPVPWLLNHLCWMRVGTHIQVLVCWLFGSWISLHKISCMYSDINQWCLCYERSFRTTVCVCFTCCIRMVSWLLHNVFGRVSPARYGVLVIV